MGPKLIGLGGLAACLATHGNLTSVLPCYGSYTTLLAVSATIYLLGFTSWVASVSTNARITLIVNFIYTLVSLLELKEPSTPRPWKRQILPRKLALKQRNGLENIVYPFLVNYVSYAIWDVLLSVSCSVIRITYFLLLEMASWLEEPWFECLAESLDSHETIMNFATIIILLYIFILWKYRSTIRFKVKRCFSVNESQGGDSQAVRCSSHNQLDYKIREPSKTQTFRSLEFKEPHHIGCEEQYTRACPTCMQGCSMLGLNEHKHYAIRRD